MSFNIIREAELTICFNMQLHEVSEIWLVMYAI